ncbi:MAG: hypothetical protein KF716_03700 [Anaerolineae bacterium]|nr:hypothetical protein [Anaerolineae bacterium]
MPTQRFALTRGEPARLELSWGLGWKNFVVRFDGVTIGTIEGGISAVREGREFPLPDGTTITVQLATPAGSNIPELQVLRNGKLLPGSTSDPEVKLRNSYNLIYVIAAINVVLGLVAAIGNVDFLQQIGLGWPSVIFGLIYVALGYFTSKRSALALGAAVVLFALDSILGVVANSAAGGSPPIGSIVVRVLFIYTMVLGFGAINALKQEMS